MIGYLKRLQDAYHLTDEETERQEKGRRLFVLFDETGFDACVGDCVKCTSYAIDRDIQIMPIH